MGVTQLSDELKLATEAPGIVTSLGDPAIIVCASPADAVPVLLPLVKVISAVVMAFTEIVLLSTAVQGTVAVIKINPVLPLLMV